MHLNKSTLCLEYFRNIVILMTKGKIVSTLGKFTYFCCYPFPIRTGVCGNHSIPQLFSRQNILKFFTEAWIPGLKVGKLTKWQSRHKNKNGKRKNPKRRLKEFTSLQSSMTAGERENIFACRINCLFSNHVRLWQIWNQMKRIHPTMP